MAFHRDSGSGGKRGGQRFGGPKPSFGGGGKSFGGGFGGDRDRKPMMHSATCADCGSRCQVPFKPNGSKPVLCSNCFGGNEGGNSFAPKRYDDKPRRTFGSGDVAVTDMLKEINNKLDLVIRSMKGE